HSSRGRAWLLGRGSAGHGGGEHGYELCPETCRPKTTHLAHLVRWRPGDCRPDGTGIVSVRAMQKAVVPARRIWLRRGRITGSPGEAVGLTPPGAVPRIAGLCRSGPYCTPDRKSDFKAPGRILQGTDRATAGGPVFF